MARSVRQARLDLTEPEARALHAAVQEALAADLLGRDYVAAARRVLERLSTKVPDWLDRAPVRGEGGYLIAAEAVLRALVAAEERGRTALLEVELASGLDAAKPAGVSITGVLTRMRREQLVRETPSITGSSLWFSAAPAGRRLLTARDGGAASDEWRVTDGEGLLELIFREHRAGQDAFRPAVQAIGRLADPEFEQLATGLRATGLLEPSTDDPNQLTLTAEGRSLAEQRVRESLSNGTFLWELPAPPLPYRRGLPLRVDRDQRSCRCGSGHAAWLAPTSKTKLHATLRRDGAVDWECLWCARRWVIFLLAHTRDGVPAFANPAEGAFTRPIWRPR